MLFRSERWQSMRDVASELKWIAGASMTVAAAPAPAPPVAAVEPPPAPPPKAASPPRAWIAATLVLLLAAVALGVPAVVHLREAPPRRPTTRFQIPPPEKAPPVSELELSPDGERLAFTTGIGAERRLWVRPLDSLAAQSLPGTEGASRPFWSPDSRSIAFFADEKLKKKIGRASCRERV